MDMYWEDLHYIKYQNLQKMFLNTGIYFISFFYQEFKLYIHKATHLSLHVKHLQVSVLQVCRIGQHAGVAQNTGNQFCVNVEVR